MYICVHALQLACIILCKSNKCLVGLVCLWKLEGARASTGLTLCVDVSSGESYK